MANNKENELDKQDSAEVKNYTRTPNMLIFGYNNISPQEKWLYVCLKHMCGKRGTRHLSLRYISEQTGISVGALSRSKDKKGNINEGMIKHLHDAGLIHSEIKKLNGRGNPLYHITITDVWGLNQEFFSKTRPNSEQDENEENEPVRNSDVPVQNSDKLARNSDKLVRNSDEPVRKPLQYQDYIQDYKQDDNNTREQERESTPNTLDTHTIVSSDTAHTEPSHCFFCSQPQTATCFECGKPVCSEHSTRYYGDMLWCDLCLDVVEVVDAARPQSKDEEVFTNDEPQGDTHATAASGHPHRLGEPATRGGDSGHGTVDNGQVATPEAGPVLEAQKEIAQTPTTTMPAQSLPLPQDAQAALGTHTRTRKAAQPKPETPKSPPVEPPADMTWGTRKCLIWFDFWRGGILIGKWKLMQASTCAKGLAEQFDEQTVIQARTDMEADPYYAAKGGCDVCDVANNIHKYLKRRHNKQKPQSPNVDSATNEPLLSVEEEFGRYWGINEKRVNEKRGVSYATA